MRVMHAQVQKKCNLCSKLFDSDDGIKAHLIKEHHDKIDCYKCLAAFRKEIEVFSHSNNCSEVIPLNIGDKCERSVVSRSVLKKHM